MNRTSILAIMAHPDDAEIWAGGTLAKHARKENVFIATISVDDVRFTEAKRGAKVLGAKAIAFGKYSHIEFQKLILKIKPRVVITHRFDDSHPDHLKTSAAVIEAVKNTKIQFSLPTKLYFCDTYNSCFLTNNNFNQKIIIDITETFDLKLAALSKHTSQPLDHFREMTTKMAAFWGSRVGTSWAEAFEIAPILGQIPYYRKL